MQIRELDLKELDVVYHIVSELRDELSYKEFEDLIYDMRHMDYKMIGIMEKDELVTYAGVGVQTNLYHKRHLYVFDFVTMEQKRGQGYGKMMLDYLTDYAKMNMCENLVFSSGFTRENAHKFYEINGFEKKSFLFFKTI